MPGIAEISEIHKKAERNNYDLRAFGVGSCTPTKDRAVVFSDASLTSPDWVKECLARNKGPKAHAAFLAAAEHKANRSNVLGKIFLALFGIGVVWAVLAAITFVSPLLGAVGIIVVGIVLAVWLIDKMHQAYRY